MIPKVIHYCWFGGKELPKSARKCIASWKKNFPDFEIKEWNENNYDVNKIPYTAQAYEAKKYAFVSDYARFDILYSEGGIYFDTDVEVVKDFDDILKNGPFMGCEIDGISKCKRNDTDQYPFVNAGLGIGAYPGMEFYQSVLDYYNKEQFYNQDGSLNMETVVTRITKLMINEGLKKTNSIQTVKGIVIYPKEYFNPKDSSTGRIIRTKNTHSIHRYDMTWLSPMQRLRSNITRPFHRIFGNNCFSFLKRG